MSEQQAVVNVRAGREFAKSVFEQLGVTFTRAEWAAMNFETGTDYPSPFADVVPFPTPSKEQ